MAPDPDSPRRLIRTIAIVAVAVVVVWALYLARHALLLIYISTLLAIGFGPLIHLIERQRVLRIGSRALPRWLAILLLYLVIIGVLLAIVLTVLPAVVQQVGELWSRLPEWLQRGEQWLIDRGLLTHHITLGEAVAKAPGTGSDAVTTVFGALWRVVGGVFGLVTILILSFYLLVEADQIFDAFVRFFPREERPRVAAISREISRKISAWLGGHLMLAGLMGAAAAIGLFLMGVPFFYVVAIVAVAGEMIPIVGPIIAGITAVAVAASVSLKLATVALVYFLILHQIESNVLVPKIMERQVGVSAVTVMIALLIGASLAGFVGAILAIPSAAILLVVTNELLFAGEPDVVATSEHTTGPAPPQ